MCTGPHAGLAYNIHAFTHSLAAAQKVAQGDDELTWCWLSAAAEQLAAQIHAHDEMRDQRAAAAAARRRRVRFLKLLVMGVITSASLMLASTWRSKPKEQQHEAATATAQCPPAAGQRAVAWSFMSDPTTNTLTGLKFEVGAAR
jgi:hypothetical protein